MYKLQRGRLPALEYSFPKQVGVARLDYHGGQP